MSRQPARTVVQGRVYCPTCKLWKLLAEFPIDRSRKLGVASWCKSCKAIYASKPEQVESSKRWRSNNTGKLKASGRRSYVRHRKKKLRYQKTYQAANLQQHNRNARRWAVSNKASVTQAQRRWRKANPENCRQHAKRTRLKHPTKMLARNQRRRALKLSVTVNPKTIAEFMHSAKSKPVAICYFCQNPFPSKKIHFDHVIPLSKGGPHEVGNLCVSCPGCNLTKSASTVSEWQPGNQGLLL